jgi:hypothetical protein
VRQVRPLRAGQVDVRQPLERLRLFEPPPLAALHVERRLVEVVELPVVVAEAHR